jgi:hypothetical protein
MERDGLEVEDVKSAILGGNIVAQMTDDPRGKRVVVRGADSDGNRDIEVVCRFLPSGLLRIITVYALRW